ncbi:hypothetical protein ACHAW6_001767 [Cyclotella cf. meneghiniana]
MSEWEGDSIAISKEIVHPGYNAYTTYNDFALIVLDSDVSPDFKPVKLKEGVTYPPADIISRAMGWGHTAEGGSLSDVTLEVDLPIITNDACYQCYNYSDVYSEWIGPNVMCTFDPGHDTCQGDSSGPLVIPGSTAKEDIQVGVVSWEMVVLKMKAPVFMPGYHLHTIGKIAILQYKNIPSQFNEIFLKNQFNSLRI